MNRPEFPENFKEQCGKYLEAKHWAKILDSPHEIHPIDWMECEFSPKSLEFNKGIGLKCHVCSKWVDNSKLMTLIKNYYDDMIIYEKFLLEKKEEYENNFKHKYYLGEGI